MYTLWNNTISIHRNYSTNVRKIFFFFLISWLVYLFCFICIHVMRNFKLSVITFEVIMFHIMGVPHHISVQITEFSFFFLFGFFEYCSDNKPMHSRWIRECWGKESLIKIGKMSFRLRWRKKQVRSKKWYDRKYFADRTFVTIIACTVV